MDDFGKSNPGQESTNEPVYFDDEDDPNETHISHAPLDLGGGSSIEMPKAKAAPKPVKAAAGPVAAGAAPLERITGMRTFFTKLHAGAMDFMSEQITDWLAKNPDITVKRTNVVTGDVVGKKVEPNLIITVWY